MVLTEEQFDVAKLHKDLDFKDNLCISFPAAMHPVMECTHRYVAGSLISSRCCFAQAS